MVFGILTAVAACPAIIGTTEAVRAGQRQNQREEHRARRCHLTVTLLRPSRYSSQFDGAAIVLKDDKLYVDTRKDVGLRELEEYFPATVKYLPYPNRKQEWHDAGYLNGEGLATLINRQRYLNWVYVDKSSHEVKFGNKAAADPNLVGPFDYTKVDRRLTFQGWEGFMAVQEADGDEMWALYHDCADNGLTGPDQIGHKDVRMLEIEIWRKETHREFEDAVSERKERAQLRQQNAT